MTQMPIPDDWDGATFVNYVVCWPDSTLWRGILAGFLTQATRGRFWDAATGSILDVQAVGREIIAKNTDSGGEILSCSDLITVLQGIQAAVEAVEAAQINIAVSADAQATSAAEANVLLVDLSRQIAVAQAWSQSIAEATASVVVENNVNLTVGNTSPALPPLPDQEPETGISDVARPSNERCDVAVWLVDGAIEFARALLELRSSIANFTISSTYGLIADAAGAVALGLRSPGSAPLLPAAVLAGMAGELFYASLEGLIDDTLNDMVNNLESNRSTFICSIYNGYQADEDTYDIRQRLEDDLNGTMDFANSVALLMLFWHPSALALLYYTSSVVTIPTTTENCDNLCGV